MIQPKKIKKIIKSIKRAVFEKGNSTESNEEVGLLLQDMQDSSPTESDENVESSLQDENYVELSEDIEEPSLLDDEPKLNWFQRRRASKLEKRRLRRAARKKKLLNNLKTLSFTNQLTKLIIFFIAGIMIISPLSSLINNEKARNLLTYSQAGMANNSFDILSISEVALADNDSTDASFGGRVGRVSQTEILTQVAQTIERYVSMESIEYDEVNLDQLITLSMRGDYGLDYIPAEDGFCLRNWDSPIGNPNFEQYKLSTSVYLDRDTGIVNEQDITNSPCRQFLDK